MMMIDLICDDNKIVKVSAGALARDVIAEFFASEKDVVAVKIDDEIIDLHSCVWRGGKISFVKSKSFEALEIIRHDAAHILAQAVKELYPDAQVTIGPVIENGFYYDFARKTPFSCDDFAMIEAKMHEISKLNSGFVKEDWDRGDAIKYFKSIGENYKAEIIDGISKDQKISVYKQGNFLDLCRGPHGLSTGGVKYFKLLKVSGAYWRGDSKNEMLQRIYGTCWQTQEELDQYLLMIEEAEKRDHLSLIHI